MRNKIKNILLGSFLLTFLSIVFFGAGIGIAEMVIQKNNVRSKTILRIPQVKGMEDKIEQLADKVVEEFKNNTAKKEEPIEEALFSFAILGDTQSFAPGTMGGFQKAIKHIHQLKPDLVFSLGDQVSSCDKKDCEKKYAEWKKVLGKYAPKTYLVQGNHDRTDEKKSDKIWQKVFNLPTNGPKNYTELVYSFDYKNSHFIILDSEKPEEHLINGEQRGWLEKDLARNKKPNIFVFFHEPAYPASSKKGESLDVNPSERNALWNILTRYKVTAVFVGHEHIQSRQKINGIYQFGFGNTDTFDHDMPKLGIAEYAYKGQAFGFVEVKEKEIVVKACAMNGKILDTFVLEKNK